MADSGKPVANEIIHKTDMDGFVMELEVSIDTWEDEFGDDQSKKIWYTQKFGGFQSPRFTTIGSLHEPAIPGMNGGDSALVERKAVVDAMGEIKDYYYVPKNCAAGDTVILDGIECLCIATGVTIQGSNLTRIAIDKNHDLGYYQKYVGMNINNVVINSISTWRWGGYGTALGNTSQEVGYGLQNTINCLANTVNYTNGTSTGTSSTGYPWLWQGVNDFRSSHSDKWFVPSINELLNYARAYRNILGFDEEGTTGGSSLDVYWSSSENTKNNVYAFRFFDGSLFPDSAKTTSNAVRLCRAF